MTGKNFDLSLKVTGDFNQAQKNAQAFANTIDEISQSAKTASTGTQSIGDAADKAAAKFTFAGKAAFSLRDNINEIALSAKTSATAMQAAGDGADKAAAKFVYAGKSTFSFRDGLRGVNTSSKEQAQELARLLSTYDALSAASLKLSQDSSRLKQAFDQGRISQEQYDRAAANIARRNQALGASYNSLRGQMSNIGFQLQDIAVQAQMGVNPLIILSQQGSQLVSGFNPLAAAIIAVGGAITGALLPSFFSASSAADDLETKIKDLDEGYKNLTESQRQFLRDKEAEKKSALLEQIEAEKKAVENLNHQLKILQETRNAPLKPAAGLPVGMGGAAYLPSTDEQQEEITKRLNKARADLDTKNQELAESEKELRRINGETVEDEKELAKQAQQTIDRLKEETETYKLTGEALGKYIADKLKLADDSSVRREIIDLYKKQEAQKKLTEAEREAEANAKRQKGEAETKQKAAEDYVKSLERQAIALEKNDKLLQDYDNAERGLTGALLERARAAQTIIAQEKDRQALAELNIQLLRAQGREQEAAQQEFENRYGDMLKRLEAAGDESGAEIIKKIIDLRKLETALSEAEKKFQRFLDDISRQENSINAQREAGLMTEYEARQKIYELHQAQAERLEALRPELEGLQNAPGEVGLAARESLAALDQEILRLQSTMTLLQSTLRDGLEAGLTDAILGLADGTMTLRDAVRSLAQSVAESLAQMAAQALAQKAVQALFGGNKDSGQNLKEGAAATTAAAGALVLAAAQWQITATQIQAAAASLAASNASGGGNSGGGSSSGNWVSTAFQMFASYYAADGGHITGPGTSTSDSIPAMLSNNEFVTRAAVVGQPGALDFLHDFNRHGMRALNLWAPARHNTGGLAGVPAPAMPAPSMARASLPERNTSVNTTLQNNQAFYLIDSPERQAEMLKSKPSVEAIKIILKNEPGEFRALLNI